MPTKWTWMMALVVGCIWLAAPASAQEAEDYDPPEEVQPDEPEAQVEEAADEDEHAERRAEARQRWQERRDRISRRDTGPRTYELDRLERMMKRELDLDREQVEHLEILFEERREEYARELAAGKERIADQRRRMSELLEQIRDARQRGDSEAEEEIRMNVRAMHEAGRVKQITDGFIAAIEEHLYESQLEPFRKLTERGRPGAKLLEAARQRPGLLRRYILRLELDDETRDRVEELYEQIREDMRSGRLGYQDRLELADEFYDQVMEVLGEEQEALLMKHLGADSRRAADPRKGSREGYRRPGHQDRHAIEDRQEQEPEDEYAEEEEEPDEQEQEEDDADEEGEEEEEY